MKVGLLCHESFVGSGSIPVDFVVGIFARFNSGMTRAIVSIALISIPILHCFIAEWPLLSFHPKQFDDAFFLNCLRKKKHVFVFRTVAIKNVNDSPPLPPKNV